MTKILIDKEAVELALETMESAIKAGDWVVDGACDPDVVFVFLRQALAVAEQHKQSTEQKPESGDYALGYSIGFGKGHEAAKTSPPQPQEAVPPQHVLMASYYKELAAQEYKRGYADAMNWKVQNHLEHLPAKGEAAPHKPLTDEEIWKDDGIMAAKSGYGATFETLRKVVRAIESAHGITGEKE